MHSPPRPFFGRPRETARVAGFHFRLLDALPDREVGLHSHAEGHVVLALAGRYVSDAARGREGPMLVYNPPGIVHRDRFAADRGRISGRFLGLTVGASVQRSLDEMAPPPSRSLHLASPHLRELLVKAWGLAGKGGPAEMLDAEFACLSFLADVTGHCPRERSTPGWVSLVRAMLAETRAEPLTVRGLAHAAGVHPVHLARVYRAATGETPGEARRRLQVMRAVSAVRQTRQSLAEIAISEGFSDQSHMTRAFRAVLGVTPGAIRGV